MTYGLPLSRLSKIGTSSVLRSLLHRFGKAKASFAFHSLSHDLELRSSSFTFGKTGINSVLPSLSHDLATNGVAEVVGGTGDVEAGGQVGNGELCVASMEVGDITLNELSVAI